MDRPPEHQRVPWRDLILLAHLIPISQSHERDSISTDGYAPLSIAPCDSFECRMDREYSSSSDTPTSSSAAAEFIAFLRSHPTNAQYRRDLHDMLEARALGSVSFASLTASCASRPPSPSKTKACSDTTPRTSWEQVLNLMRNIVCHEESFEFAASRQLTVEALRFFGSHEALSRTIRWYYELVVVPRRHKRGILCHEPLVFSTTHAMFYPPDDSSQSWREMPQRWRDLVLLANLIPCRELNDIVDLAVEEQLDRLSETLRFGSWEAFSLYIRTHPANYEQLSNDGTSFSWIVTFRLLRNILGHESQFDWSNLDDLARHTYAFFGSPSDLHQAIRVYQRCCSGSLDVARAPTDLQDVHSVAAIQLKSPENFVLGAPRHAARFEVLGGVRQLGAWLKDALLSRKVLLITGQPGSGKSMASQCLVPHLVRHQHRASEVPLVLVCPLGDHGSTAVSSSTSINSLAPLSRLLAGIAAALERTCPGIQALLPSTLEAEPEHLAAELHKAIATWMAGLSSSSSEWRSKRWCRTPARRMVLLVIDDADLLVCSEDTLSFAMANPSLVRENLSRSFSVLLALSRISAQVEFRVLLTMNEASVTPLDALIRPSASSLLSRSVVLRLPVQCAYSDLLDFQRLMKFYHFAIERSVIASIVGALLEYLTNNDDSDIGTLELSKPIVHHMYLIQDVIKSMQRDSLTVHEAVMQQVASRQVRARHRTEAFAKLRQLSSFL